MKPVELSTHIDDRITAFFKSAEVLEQTLQLLQQQPGTPLLVLKISGAKKPWRIDRIDTALCVPRPPFFLRNKQDEVIIRTNSYVKDIIFGQTRRIGILGPWVCQGDFNTVIPDYRLGESLFTSPLGIDFSCNRSRIVIGEDAVLETMENINSSFMDSAEHFLRMRTLALI